MSEVYDSEYILDGLRDYVKNSAEGAFDGFEVTFPQGQNTLDPLLMIKLGTLDASLEDQVTLTKSLILNKPVRIALFGEEIGSIQINDINQGFGGFSVFQNYPMALQMLIRTCFISVLKNLLPPLSDSQRAAMKARMEAKEKASSQANGS